MSPRSREVPAVAALVDARSSRSMTEQVYDLLKEEILRVERRPGDMLAEADLAARFGVSKTPVREALRLLAQDGWVVVLPRKGYLIRPLRLDDVREIFAIRAMIEPTVAAQAAKSAEAADVERLRALVDEQADAVGDAERAFLAARRFHIGLVEISGNRRMSRIVVELLDEVRRLHSLLPSVDSHLTSQEELQAHRGLVEALAAGDADRAAEVMAEHVAEVARALVHGFSGV
jgi:DNA-binding GntR family transcriptional regulator